MTSRQRYWHLPLGCRLRLSVTLFISAQRVIGTKKAEEVTLGRFKGRKSSPAKYKLSGKEHSFVNC